MENKKSFVIYKDLIVREYKVINKDIMIDAIGVIECIKGERTYKPTKFKEGYHDYTVNLQDWEIQENEIKLNNKFKIVRIYEDKHESSRFSYYRVLTITVEDIFGVKKDYNIQIDPFIDNADNLFSYEDIQGLLFKIKNDIESHNSFEMMELYRKNEALRQELETCKERNRELVNKNHELHKENKLLLENVKK